MNTKKHMSAAAVATLLIAAGFGGCDVSDAFEDRGEANPS